MKATQAMACPCGKGRYAHCCEPLHAGTPAPTAEALMRSRYSAYVLELADYVLATWHAPTRPAELSFDDEPTRWLGLEIKHHAQSENTATVEFLARYKINGRAYRLHEISRFIRDNGYWYYIDGELLEK